MTRDENPLSKYRAPRAAGAAFVATREGGIALVEPLTPRAEGWLRAYLENDAVWVGPAVAVEMGYFPPLADAIIAAGFMFERGALPN